MLSNERFFISSDVAIADTAALLGAVSAHLPQVLVTIVHDCYGHSGYEWFTKMTPKITHEYTNKLVMWCRPLVNYHHDPSGGYSAYINAGEPKYVQFAINSPSKTVSGPISIDELWDFACGLDSSVIFTFIALLGDANVRASIANLKSSLRGTIWAWYNTRSYAAKVE
jgi:hypothetical protein